MIFGEKGVPIRKLYKWDIQHLSHCMWVSKEEMEFKMIPQVETQSLEG